MKVTKSEAKIIDRNFARIFSYPSPSKAISVAYIEVNGRHPSGRDKQFIEHDLHVLFYVIKGNAVVTIDNKQYKVTEGDSIIIQPGKKYWIEGKISYIAVTTPAYYSEQNEVVK